MKKITNIFALTLLSILMSGCATSGYFADRGNDSLDIFTLTSPLGAGFGTRIGPFHTGLNISFAEIGLRGGVIEEQAGFHFAPINYEVILNGYDRFYPQEIYFGNAERCAIKRYRTDEDDLILPFVTSGLEIKGCYNSEFKNMLTHPYLTQVEAQAGLLYGIKFGFNIGELFDFILGWTTIDIYNDDYWYLKEKEEKKKSNKTD